MEKQRRQALVGMSIYDPTDPMGKCSPPFWPPLLSLKLTSSDYGPRRAWLSHGQRVSSGENSRNSLKNNKKNSHACMPPVTIPSVIWQRSLRSQSQRSAELCTAQERRSALSVLFCPIRHETKLLKPGDHRNHPHPENLRWHRERVFGQIVDDGPLPWG